MFCTFCYFRSQPGPKDQNIGRRDQDKGNPEHRVHQTSPKLGQTPPIIPAPSYPDSSSPNQLIIDIPQTIKIEEIDIVENNLDIIE